MTDFLRPAAQLLILLPGLLLSYLPMRQCLRLRPKQLTAIAVPMTVLLCLLGGWLCVRYRIKTEYMLFLLAAVTAVFYTCTLRVSRWKSVSVFLAVCGVFACLGSLVRAVDAMLYPAGSDPWLSFKAALIYNLLCWAFVGLCVYPATHAVQALLEDEAFAQTWYVFWILPLLFIGLNLFMLPLQPEILYQGRLIQIYMTVSLVLLIFLLLFYALFYLIAASLNKNDRLRQENHFLAMQQTQYDNLRLAIAETRQARHDMRHHFNALQSLAERGAWTELESYLAEAQERIPTSELSFCDNPAVDGVVGYYGISAEQNSIPFSAELDLPRELPISEMDLCLILSNLLENAVEASLKTAPAKRYITLRGYTHSKSVLVLSVENAFDGNISEKDGVFRSSKRRGDGVGIQSVRRIAEKNGGYSRFTYADGIFCAEILLRGE